MDDEAAMKMMDATDTVEKDLPSQEEEAGFKICTIVYRIESNSTLPILDGAMKITCGHTGMSVKARICTHEDFGGIQSSITEKKRVRLKKKGVQKKGWRKRGWWRKKEMKKRD